MSVFFANKSNFVKLIFAIILAIPISYINFNQLNFHGDYNFFKDAYSDFEIIFIPKQITFIIKNIGAQLDPLLALILYISKYILPYEYSFHYKCIIILCLY